MEEIQKDLIFLNGECLGIESGIPDEQHFLAIKALMDVSSKPKEVSNHN